MDACTHDILIADDTHVDFAPDLHQLARKRIERPIPRWQIAIPVIAMTLLMICWLAARPGAKVAHGAVSLAQPAEAAHKIELFQLPEWHDEPAPAKPIETADAR